MTLHNQCLDTGPNQLVFLHLLGQHQFRLHSQRQSETKHIKPTKRTHMKTTFSLHSSSELAVLILVSV